MGGLLPILALWLLPSTALAKRTAPPKVPDVTHEGIRYHAPNEDGRRAVIEAFDALTGKKLWEKTIYRKTINPLLEEDVQWVFIKEMTLKEGALIIVNERGVTYALDLKTKEVRALKPVAGK